ncbi:hydroxymethylbilane synthase [Helicobacter suis]|uniref:Porphobilinogen deaminase n=1 Tax=Helicobacter suis TaxID=104628 RepID=A0A6J4CWG9_9HELI|nr:hydroxymethylbilane synthase [Helicobacter suis]BCD69859.1 Porphobilinogen deaminase HemC [Helicobacter suis]
MKPLIIGSRGSALALWQARYIQTQLESLGLLSVIEVVKTKGDKILDVPLAKIGGKGLFTKELEELLLSKDIDLAVHSLKDVPVEFVGPLDLACVSVRADARDCFLSFKSPNFKDLPKGAKVGTTSLRRSMQLKRKRPDLDTLSLRGNVQTRLKRLEAGEFDAIVLACAGVERLQIKVPYQIPFEIEEMIPCMGQGALGVEMCTSHPLFNTIAGLNDSTSAFLCGVERLFVKKLGGGCQVPIGVHASLKGDHLEICAVVGLVDGSQMIKEKIQGLAKQANTLVQTLLDRFLAQGAKEILAKAL